MEPIWTETDSAKYLNVSPRTLQRWRVQGCGPKFVKLGKKVGYTERDLVAFVESRRRQSTSEKPTAA
jgi:hypothetical protein